MRFDEVIGYSSKQHYLRVFGSLGDRDGDGLGYADVRAQFVFGRMVYLAAHDEIRLVEILARSSLRDRRQHASVCPFNGHFQSLARPMLRHGDVTWSNPKVISTLAIIFLCGAAFGAVITRGYIHSRWTAQATPSPAIEKARHVGLGNLTASLNLTAAQEQQITKILDDYGKFYQNIEDEREDVAEYGRQRILNALTPEQRVRFNDMITPHGRP